MNFFFKFYISFDYEQIQIIYSLDVYAFFTMSCYKGFGDDDGGFFQVYRKVFEQLAAEDIEYMDDPEEYEQIPKFGNSKTSFEVVVNFYGFWESYSTKKSYSWLFTHNIQEYRDRRVLKLLDKEHKKIQHKARKERNEEVRSLVMFVKKRDKRMTEYKKMLEEKALQNRLKSEQNNLEQIRNRQQQIKEQQKNSQVKNEHEEQLRELEQSYLNQYSDSEEESSDGDEVQEGIEECNLSDSEIFDDELYCVACNKFFNSDSAKKNHEASKKHKSNVELIKTEMETEEENYQQAVKEDSEDLSEAEEEVEAEPAKKSKGKKSKKKSKKVYNYDDSEPEEAEKPVEEETVEEISTISTKSPQSDDSDDWSNSKKPKKVKSKPKQKTTKPEPEKEPEPEPEPVQIHLPTEEDENENRCATCNELFPSKNKLFSHLKKTNHSIYLGEPKQKTGEKTNSRKKKK